MKTLTRKSLYPVSKNFYASISARVSESLNLIGRQDAVEPTMAYIDRYMTDGTAPAADADPCILLTFNLLRSEIDKALLRSHRARQRAAVKTAKAVAMPAPEMTIPSETAENAESADDEAEPAPFVPRNRRERRFYEQELRRQTRRALRQLVNCAK